MERINNINSNKKIDIISVNGVSVKKEIYDDFIMDRVKYLCRKGIALISNDDNLLHILDKIMMLTKFFNINNDIGLKKEISTLITNINQYIEKSEKYSTNELNILKKIYKLHQVYDISDREILISINENIARVQANRKTLQISGNVNKVSNENDDEMMEQIEKLYYQKVYEIIVQMGNEIGNATDEEKIRWIYNYVLNLKYASIPNGCLYSAGGVTRYDTTPAARKINRLGQIVSLNSSEVGKRFEGVFSKYNLVFSNEREGLCGAKSGLIEDLCDFCLNKRNYCIAVNGIHMGVAHGWNAIINANGVYHFDASKNWHGKEIQYLTSESELKHKWPSYNTNRIVYNYTSFHKISIVDTDEVIRLNHRDNRQNESVDFHFTSRRR